jgi:hypothetical protein
MLKVERLRKKDIKELKKVINEVFCNKKTKKYVTFVCCIIDICVINGQ